METRKLWLQFFPQWVLANIVGWATYSLISVVQFFVCGVFMAVAFFIGYFQWLVLKKYMRVDVMWLWTSTLTYGLYFWVLFFIVQKRDSVSILNATLINILALGILGLFQKSVLNYYVNTSFVWIIVNPIAGTLGFVPAVRLIMLSNSTDTSLLLIWASYGIIYGIITGVTLASLYIPIITATRSQINL